MHIMGMLRSDHQHGEPVSAVATYYDLVADEYDGYYFDPLSRAENEIVKQLLKEKIALGAKVLDLGCGTGLGYDLADAEKRHLEYQGMDISESMVARGKKRLGAKPNCNLFVGDMSDLSVLQCNSYDAVISLFGS